VIRSKRRVLVATDHRRCPLAALEHAGAMAGDGEVVLAAILVVPVTEAIDAPLGGAEARAGEVLAEAGDAVESRVVRSRSFARGVLDAASDDAFDALVIEHDGTGAGPSGADQVATILERAAATVVLVRPGPPVRRIRRARVEPRTRSPHTLGGHAAWSGGHPDRPPQTVAGSPATGRRVP
jgi:hypothetical protein